VPGAEQPADVAHRERIARKERDVGPAVDVVGVSLSRDRLVPTAVSNRERIPKRARPVEDSHMPLGIERQLDEEREYGGRHPEKQRPPGNSDRRYSIQTRLRGTNRSCCFDRSGHSGKKDTSTYGERRVSAAATRAVAGNAASWLPARRAAAIAPTMALRDG